jgi:hypothetical protein
MFPVIEDVKLYIETILSVWLAPSDYLPFCGLRATPTNWLSVIRNALHSFRSVES